jgi:hypothetical protein
MVYRWWLHAVGIFILSSSLHKRESEMSRTVLLVLSTAVAILVASGAVLALPSEKPDKTPMVNGTVRAIEQVGTNLWLGGKFTQVKRHKGTVVANVSNLAVFDSKTKQYKNFAPKLGGKNSEVWDMTLYGEDVLIAGEFSGPRAPVIEIEPPSGSHNV